MEKTGHHQLELLVVSRSDKKPIAGASIDVSYWDDDRAARDRREKRTLRVRARSTCRLVVSSITFFAAKDGFVRTADSWSESKLRQGLPLTFVQELEPGSPIGGLVKDEQGQPVAGCRGQGRDRPVEEPRARTSICLKAAAARYTRGFPSIAVKTDAQGRWRCFGLAEGCRAGYSPLVQRRRMPDHVSDSGGYSRRLSLKTARAMTGALVLRTGMQVAGQAHDAHGKAVSGATVILAYSAKQRRLSSHHDRPGRAVCIRPRR